MSILNGYKMHKCDYVLAFPQAEAVNDHTFMEIPRGFDLEGRDRGDYVLKIEKNVYGGCDAGRIWYQHLVEHLIHAGFTHSAYNDCLFYRGHCLYVLYTMNLQQRMMKQARRNQSAVQVKPPSA